MSATDARTVRLAEWARALPSGRVAGSLYSVAPGSRIEAAEVLASQRMPIHVDLILAPDERGALVHRGVSPAEVRAVRAASPEARIELHLILVSGAELSPEAPELRDILELAGEVAAVRVALPGPLAADTAVRAAFESANCEVWRELPPSQRPTCGPGASGGSDADGSAAGGSDADRPDADDRADAGDRPEADDRADTDALGTLVMLIEPGTRDMADPALVERVGELAGRVAVAVDGGVDPELAQRALSLGADHVVAGRALFITHDTTTGERRRHP